MSTKPIHLISDRLSGVVGVTSLLAVLGCTTNTNSDFAPIAYSCGTVADPSMSGVGSPSDCTNVNGVNVDAMLPLEPSLPADPGAACTLKAMQATTATNWIPDETTLDTARIVAALSTCSVVRLVTDGVNNAFVASNIQLTSKTLWVDAGVTLYASRNPALYQLTGSCGVSGINDSGACNDFLTVGGTNPAVVGDGIIDGQGGELLIGYDYSWWQLSGALQAIDGSIGNPTLVNVKEGTIGFLLYKITLHNSPKFHVKISATQPGGTLMPCVPGQGYTVWGITLLTPSHWLNMQGLPMSPHFARNTDGVDPGEGNIATCGVIAHNIISTGDDHIALKGGHWVSNVIIAHNHFGTGHGMSIGSETYGSYTDTAGGVHRGVDTVTVCDLTIDADSRPVGTGASLEDSNGIRVKSDSSRGGIVNNVIFQNVCMRDVSNVILMSTAYNPLFAGTDFPQFSNITFQNIHYQTCMFTGLPVVTLNGFNTAYPANNITLNNVIVDNVGPEDIESEYANLTLGPGNVNFMPSGPDVQVANNIAAGSTPITCSFPQLPVPELPPGWLR